MPRLTDPLLAHKVNIKKFTNYVPTYPYVQKLPAVLRDSVSMKKDKRKVASCLQEISTMLICLKKHDFSQMPCSSEIAAFHKCQQEHEAAQRRKQETESRGGMSGSSGRINSKQLNALLAKYPQPKPK